MRRLRRIAPPATLDPQLVLGAYAVGVFPMAEGRDADDVFWVEPQTRAVMPLGGFHLSASLRKTLARDRFRVTVDTAFGDIVRLCAEAVDNRPDTWINPQIERVFGTLHAMGFAHSVEVWDGAEGEWRLAGGLYGLALGRAFFGESMVSRATDASKVAMAWLVARLRVGGFSLLDCQFMTGHLASLGAVEVSRADYLSELSSAVEGVVGAGATAAGAADFFALDRGFPASGAASDGARAPPGKVIAQLLGHTS